MADVKQEGRLMNQLEAKVTAKPIRWTTADLDHLPDNATRYEIIDGELIMSRAPHWRHQLVADNICALLNEWSRRTKRGQSVTAPGILFSESDNVIPDVAWASFERLEMLLDEAGHLTGAPELVAEILSEGSRDQQRDREVKLKLYSIRGVQEYWIVDRYLQEVTVYRREQAVLVPVMTLQAADQLISPLLPGFSCQVSQIFA